MQDFLYNWFGLNKSLFISFNKLTNIGFLPYLLDMISSLFFIGNFAIIYIITCVFFYFKIKNKQVLERIPNAAASPIITVKSENSYFFKIYNELVRIGICYALFGFVFAALKFSVNLPRPFCSLPPENFTTIANISIERCLSSFPSAHTGLSIFLAYCLWPYTSKLSKSLLYLIVIAVATSRITLAMHYPADIFYSSIITALIIVTGNFLYNLLEKRIIDPVGSIIFKLIFQ